MRLFVAIQLSEEIRKSLIGTMHDLKQAGIKGNYSPAANLHVTLAFIGETRQSDEVKKALQRVEIDRLSGRQPLERHADRPGMRLAEDRQAYVFSVAAAHALPPPSASKSSQKRG